MEFFDKLGKKASEAYKITADKTGKIAKETKLKFRIGELKNKIDEQYKEIGKKVYEKHVREEEIKINEDLAEFCDKIDEMTKEIKDINNECLELKDKKQCPNCLNEIETSMKFCPECGAEQIEEQEKQEPIETDIDNSDNSDDSDNENQIEPQNEEVKEETDSNLEKTTEIEVNPDTEDITETEVEDAGESII